MHHLSDSVYLPLKHPADSYMQKALKRLSTDGWSLFSEAFTASLLTDFCSHLPSLKVLISATRIQWRRRSVC